MQTGKNDFMTFAPAIPVCKENKKQTPVQMKQRSAEVKYNYL